MITALYSDQFIAENAPMDRRLAALILSRGNRIGYIASGPEPQREFFNEKRRYYRSYGLSLDLFFDLDVLSGDEEIGRLFSCSAIHLTGGHTGDFLRRLRQSGMLEKLRAWARDDGIVVGISAGAILMTPTIAVDALFSGSSPDAVRDGAALGLVPFEFFPHLNDDPGYLSALLRYSEMTVTPILACRDGEGLILGNGLVEIFGAPLMISGGFAEAADRGRIADLLSRA
ncbi:type 1 glutamine amidotransferase-like domain-containing protein [Rhizobium leguminosarum]|uniref:Type 1 glutamine amidotransferase-like domain-containing protein n=1 Tax=Rhizobium leguminosarum TaxID=384 RepID=A0AAJ1A8G4_RHILE|nr:Type 1 glutamine amidotransferase-like domain-containing protein [Rhizobium leguminosarum]MBY5535253.1 type 1 glutamine amidotransferase-like domain-containing protein [Rhizobium leguminosarum]MBY5597230.1 type 1 glutamine amidotransferase-like domain-containing protein [Rhizobium leguminosarum]MBY5615425.1 type 1 glutamine amidotransferase-like domain-containing protein [Rhizobium leguminosarum]MBY5629249.1 type 1 glutamine amidotransferase-like domain-containing protein [Rhizobium legumino